ncbi:hypothetical protein BMT49_03180 [Escherichia coli]|nr:hypothetical protein BMT49_03180 [Escherichia coli]
MANVRLPDALCLSGLPDNCNILILHDFVGRVRRSRRIRQKQRALCQPPERPILCYWAFSVSSSRRRIISPASQKLITHVTRPTA